MNKKVFTVWITGAGGLIGNYLVQLAPPFAAHWQTRPLTRHTVDLLDSSAVRKLFTQEKPAAIIHCAAMSKSSDCQAQPALAHRINVESTALLAELAADIPFIFFSTDLVFDGRKGNYVETDDVNPLSIYAETKVAAEKIVLQNPRHTVIRTSLNGGRSPRGDSGFNEQLRRDWQAGRVPRFFMDEFRCPIAAEVTARATWKLLHSRATGLFHVAGSERMSRLEIGKVVAGRCPELKPGYESCSLREYSGAPRAPDTSLDCGKAQKRLSFCLPGLSEWLRNNLETFF